ncbi:TPA_asm: UL32.6 [Human alphaherpesvirus 1]|uniref:Uncharacterized protein n=2 Tax=Human herpesvirus 1 TaxID=10298 RepID=A0A2Z4GZT4_HHV1|nr:hypothetical protein [Human alphaherpesvirus 1]DAC85321.1 TPA_asm: UL32.6 [Human alphaherpesvirus 1]
MVRQTRQGRSSAKVSMAAAEKGPVSKSPSPQGSGGGLRGPPRPPEPPPSPAPPRALEGAVTTSAATSSSSVPTGGTPIT